MKPRGAPPKVPEVRSFEVGSDRWFRPHLEADLSALRKDYDESVRHSKKWKASKGLEGPKGS